MCYKATLGRFVNTFVILLNGWANLSAFLRLIQTLFLTNLVDQKNHSHPPIFSNITLLVVYISFLWLVLYAVELLLGHRADYPEYTPHKSFCQYKRLLKYWEEKKKEEKIYHWQFHVSSRYHIQLKYIVFIIVYNTQVY